MAGHVNSHGPNQNLDEKKKNINTEIYWLTIVDCPASKLLGKVLRVGSIPTISIPNAWVKVALFFISGMQEIILVPNSSRLV